MAFPHARHWPSRHERNGVLRCAQDDRKSHALDGGSGFLASELRTDHVGKGLQLGFRHGVAAREVMRRSLSKCEEIADACDLLPRMVVDRSVAFCIRLPQTAIR